MIIKILKTEEDVAKATAGVFVAQVNTKPNSVLGFATGSTPVKMYGEMIKAYKEGIVDFSKITTFNLDEYYNLPKEHKESYYSFMMRNLFDGLNTPKENINILNGMAKDPEKECADYENKMDDAGGIDLQILGIGHNGHIGFNEPDDKFTYETHKVTLTESTINANKIYFESEEEMPKAALTMGMGQIMKAKKIVLLAYGKGKAEAIYNMINGPIGPNNPASILRFHNDVTVLVDEAAGSKL